MSADTLRRIGRVLDSGNPTASEDADDNFMRMLGYVEEMLTSAWWTSVPEDRPERGEIRGARSTTYVNELSGELP